MAVVINTNLESIRIRSDLTNATSSMSKAMQRMSTGMKINSACDDAAGAVISARMQVQLNGNRIAQNNVQNGNAMLSTAEGNIDIVLDNVSRIRDLTLQAKNGTYSTKEIEAIQDEVAERIAEINRVSRSSKYSELLLFGSEELVDGVTFQVGANATENDIIHATKGIFESIEFDKITHFEAIDEVKKAEAQLVGGGDADTKNDLDLTKYNGTEGEVGGKLGDGTAYYKKSDAMVEGAFYCYAANADGEPEGSWYVLDETEYADAGAAAAAGAIASDKLGVAAIAPDAETFEYLNLMKLEDEAAFNEALIKLDDAIDNLTGRKSQIGSAQNRLGSALDALTIQYENLSSAKSIITDADIAEESSNYTQHSILQQITTSLLAQANQAPSIAMSLI